MNKRHVTPGMMSGMGPTYPNGGNSGNPNFMNRPVSGRPQHQPAPGMGGSGGPMFVEKRLGNFPLQ